MKVLDLFGGAGGAALGLEMAGFTTVSVERDHLASEAARLAGLHSIETDVSSTDGFEKELQAKVWWASPPCQPFSSSGKRLGSGDDRDGFPVLLSAIDEARRRDSGSCQWLIIEQVVGILQHRSKSGCRRGVDPKPDACPGCYFKWNILPELDKRFRYVDLKTLLAADYGVPQKRKRVFIVCGPTPYQWPEATHAEKPEGDLLPWTTVGDALPHLVESCDAIRHEGGQAQARPLDMPAPTVGTKGTLFTASTTEGAWVSGDRNASKNRMRVIGAGRNPQSKALAHTRTFRDISNEPSPTVCAVSVGNRGPWSVSEKQVNGEWVQLQKRRLLPRELGVLQGFPEDYPWQGNIAQRHRQVGNAVPPRMAEVLGLALLPELIYLKRDNVSVDSSTRMS
jgi:DNA (cytosine-5)-methyltransferase 1